MIEAAKVIVPIDEGREVEARASTRGLEAQTEPYPEDGLDEVLIWIGGAAAYSWWTR